MPRPCHWHEEPDGTRTLIPGCAARAHDPDAECTCPSTASQLAFLRAELDAVRRDYRRFRRWHHCLLDALRTHPDGPAIYATAQKGHRR
ncbi:hypothetical protein [Streptomyces mobaraensis]|uniref:Uncharacterized protein n=1 Tax=Streptomyces mobaraensis TaxID=35621 RepID=A0A5N5WD18_STRMB|nr:hypothetical protein [Streptomyces mobaraensis]KAB7850172.1 hypothetical protein FRZ00_06125 [Streptomyces mobaraensis]